jgi:hypothetical protein
MDDAHPSGVPPAWPDQAREPISNAAIKQVSIPLRPLPSLPPDSKARHSKTANAERAIQTCPNWVAAKTTKTSSFENGSGHVSPTMSLASSRSQRAPDARAAARPIHTMPSTCRRYACASGEGQAESGPRLGRPTKVWNSTPPVTIAVEAK